MNSVTETVIGSGLTMPEALVVCVLIIVVGIIIYKLIDSIF